MDEGGEIALQSSGKMCYRILYVYTVTLCYFKLSYS